MISTLWAYVQMAYWIARPQRLFSRLYQLPWYRTTLQQAFALGKHKSGKILEVGCAGGDFTRSLAQSGLTVWGVDRSSLMIQQASCVDSDVCFVQADATSLPFADLYFDHVFAASLLNIVDQPHAVMTELYRVCRGTVTIVIPVAGFSNTDAARSARSLRGFSQLAFLLWHRLGKKVERELINTLFLDSKLQVIEQRYLLGGMVFVMTGQRDPQPTKSGADEIANGE